MKRLHWGIRMLVFSFVLIYFYFILNQDKPMYLSIYCSISNQIIYVRRRDAKGGVAHDNDVPSCAIYGFVDLSLFNSQSLV